MELDGDQEPADRKINALTEILETENETMNRRYEESVTKKLEMELKIESIENERYSPYNMLEIALVTEEEYEELKKEHLQVKSKIENPKVQNYSIRQKLKTKLETKIRQKSQNITMELETNESHSKKYRKAVKTEEKPERDEYSRGGD
ncbi:hypothetical protein HHI36_005120 [Cryptolaemus montrouzieri]|uniref:Uncharacterized protein n=1 Tax=Cryptolaemus montrouzieri TaxID=559131 RepID=A0ABD2NT61_9CUCU